MSISLFRYLLSLTFYYKNNNKLFKKVNSETSISISILIYKLVIWNKARVIYYVNNWIYTTNHKRIAVNYFWFVIVSGIVGMVLATIIRLEMAYPGVGILAGDSLQYLSVVTAHAVIMVFFMIMPLVFGAFGNFLLPTQLGVHDVAFPRLNSAAFWFLPGGLIMLCQLVCLDRRYQRMNCFNIREVESLLKGRFFPDLVNSQDHHVLLNNSMIGLRFKTNNLDSINHNVLLFSQYGLSTKGGKRYINLITNDLTSVNNYEFYSYLSWYKSFLTFLESFLFSSGNYMTKFFTDTYLYFIDTLSPNVSSDITLTQNFSSFTGLFTSFFNFLKSILERQALIFFYWSDLSKPSSFLLNWLAGLQVTILDSFISGFIENNMAIHKTFINSWPSITYPTINTDSGFLSFYFTTISHIFSRSLFLFFYTAWLNLNKIISIWFYKLSSWTSSIFLYWTYNFVNVFSNNFFYTFGLKVIYDISLNFLLAAQNFYLNILTSLYTSFSLGFFFLDLQLFSLKFLPSFISTGFGLTVPVVQESTYLNKGFQSVPQTKQVLNNFSEESSFFRYQRALNPVFKYDYKLGNYFTKDDMNMTPFLFTTINDVTGGIRKSSWFFSAKFVELFNTNVKTYLTSYSGQSSSGSNLSNPYVQNSFGFYNFLYNLQDNSTLINYRWLALSAMDQKFHKMFLTSSMQQRVFANWRQLKFTREAWRCKLLTARHQKTLYHRYSDEDGIFWAIERNAKDVLPGWAMITPFSARVRFTAIGKVDIGLMGVFLVLNSSIVSSANFLVTYRYLSTLNNRKMRDARSFFTEGVMVASWMMIAANPMLVIGILMLLADRHWQTSFFDYSGGGDTVLFQHMFWFFGHPEVYVIMIPAFGFNNTILSFYLRKRVSARASLLYSMYTIAFLGFFVWGHHMYMVGLAHTTRMLFSTLTVMISVPAATKLMHWCVTLVNSSFAMELPFFFMLLFIFFFVSGGISGMAVAHTGMDILFHDTFYVVGHFHVMFAGSAMFANFGAFYFYFPSIFGVKFSRIYGYLHCIYFLTGQVMTVVPMIWLGYSGMPRRVLDYPASLGGWHAIVSAGHLLSVAGLMAFFIMIFDSLRQARAVTRNTFGISRFNTRLNFYLYEIARTKYIQRKGWYVSRFNTSNRIQLNKVNYSNNEYLETVLFSYTFIKPKGN